jgi:excisionase family DNA binding protein
LTPSPRPISDPGWLSLGQASRLLGVSQGTLRRWADDGRLRVFTTPGGHRRFSRDAIERLLPADRDQRPHLGLSGLTPARLANAYRRSATAPAEGSWGAVLADADRNAFRDLGRRLAQALVEHLDAVEPAVRTERLAEATDLSADYGRLGARAGLSMGEVVEGFLAFRRPFLAEAVVVARRRGFDMDEVTGLYDDAEQALDHLLVATMSGHGLARSPRRRVRIPDVAGKEA